MAAVVHDGISLLRIMEQFYSAMALDSFHKLGGVRCSFFLASCFGVCRTLCCRIDFRFRCDRGFVEVDLRAAVLSIHNRPPGPPSGNTALRRRAMPATVPTSRTNRERRSPPYIGSRLHEGDPWR